jgi:hypothetical protein
MKKLSLFIIILFYCSSLYAQIVNPRRDIYSLNSFQRIELRDAMIDWVNVNNITQHHLNCNCHSTSTTLRTNF